MIKMDHVSFSYKETIFENISLEIKPCKITFIIGLNGSGKSTLAQLLGGLMLPQKGFIKIDDLLINKRTKNSDIRKKVGIVFQNPDYPILFPTVYEDIKFVLDNVKTPKDQIDTLIEESLDLVGMKEYMYANPSYLSDGQKQRIAIATQIVLHPNYMIFDEVTSFLDVKARKEFYKLLLLLKKKMGIIFITNNIEELIYAEEVFVVENKKIYAYSIHSILKNNAILYKHNLSVPFLFKLCSKLQIDSISKNLEQDILERLCKK